MYINLPSKVDFIINKLIDNNFEAFIVGGSVRDSLLNITPKDWDITTNALPFDIMNIFPNSIPTGLKHGTITVVIEKEHFEVTTYRVEDDYKDFRRPSSVKFVNSIKEDLSRRDFTINSMAYNHTFGLVDPFNGRKDLGLKNITSVGDANKRFNEDALRMLRAIRFSSQLNFEIDKSTLDALIKNNYLIKNVSKERITEEISKLLLSKSPDKGITYLSSTSMISNLFSTDFYDINNLINSIKISKHHLGIRYSLFIYYLCKDNKDITRSILDKLKLDNKTLNLILHLNLNKDYYNKLLSKYDIKVFINKLGLDLFADYLYFEEIIAKSENHKEGICKIKSINKQFNDIIKNNEPLTLKDLKVTGNDIKSLGVPSGKDIGIMLNKALDIVFKKPELNDKDSLISILKDTI
ncbi:CCA tRNA nucleotidyltransferase [Clostridium algidicarnis]|uniref:CCA tRNA nucleotidyltransferase n=1 Tax=Clostridium algidicarnis TaxID=37659 RepID=UPI0004958767|nr:CCA tRNA nucleotidyltransferase [Clostridium algidicarnis]